MAADREIEALVGTVAAAITKSISTDDKAKMVGSDYADAMEAGAQAATSLVILFLSDIKRMADSLEILARVQLDKSNLALFPDDSRG